MFNINYLKFNLLSLRANIAFLMCIWISCFATNIIIESWVWLPRGRDFWDLISVEKAQNTLSKMVMIITNECLCSLFYTEILFYKYQKSIKKNYNTLKNKKEDFFFLKKFLNPLLEYWKYFVVYLQSHEFDINKSFCTFSLVETALLDGKFITCFAINIFTKQCI